MKKNIRSTRSMNLALVIALVCITGIATLSSSAQAVAPPPRAAVQALQGGATLGMDPDHEPEKIAVGSIVEAWNTVSTNENSKLFLKWETGVLNSMGEFSSIFLATRETERGSTDVIEMTEGLLRVTTKSGGGALTPYMVVTPAASIEPAHSEEAVDFIVEVYAPATSFITVVSGNVRIKNLTLSKPTETVLAACQSVYVEEGKPKLEPLASSPEDLLRLVEGTTIPGTIVANLDVCPVAPQPRAAERRVSGGPRYTEASSYSDYEFEDWDFRDRYLYDEITILPPEPGVGSVVILPGVGRWIIPIAAFAGWRFDPDIIRMYARHIVLDNIIYRDQYYLADLRLQQRQFSDLVYLSQLSGNRDMLWDAQRQLASVNIQEHWANMNLSRLQDSVAGLDQERQKFGNKLPQGNNLFQAVSNSFNSPQNLKVAQTFRDKIRTDLNVQSQLAGLAGKELTDLRSKVAHERDPQKRLSLRDELTKINKDVAQGKLPVQAKQPQVKQVVERLAKEQDPKKIQDLQKRLGQLTKTETTRNADILAQDKLSSLKQDLAKFPNPQKRTDLEAKVAQLGQSVEERNRAQINREKIDAITTKAANQGNEQKRNELLGQLKELGKTQETGPAGRLGVLGQRRNLESQLSIEQDKEKRAGLEKALEDQRKKQAELLPQQRERGKQPESLSGQKEDRQKRTEQQGQQKEQAEQTQRQQQQTEKKQSQQQEQQKQLEQKRSDQADQQRQQKQQADQVHKQQEQRQQKEQAEQTQRRQQQTEQKQAQQQEQQKQLEQRRSGEAEQQRQQKQQADQVHKQQEQRQEPQVQQRQEPQAQQRREQPQQQRQEPQVQQRREQPQQQQQEPQREEQPGRGRGHK